MSKEFSSFPKFSPTLGKPVLSGGKKRDPAEPGPLIRRCAAVPLCRCAAVPLCRPGPETAGPCRQSLIWPSVVMVTTCQGRNFPLAWMARFTASSIPPQQGTSMRTMVTLLMELLAMISVSFPA